LPVAELHVEQVLTALNRIPGLCHRLPLIKLLNAFQECAKGRQLYIQQPTIAAICYAKNDKRGGFTGGFRNITSTSQLTLREFMARHALPGPGSVTTCIVQEHGPLGDTELFKMVKLTDIS
jgi:hypothetical protein